MARENDERWNNDPYAETAVRLFNYIVGQGFTNHSIGATEEEKYLWRYKMDKNLPVIL